MVRGVLVSGNLSRLTRIGSTYPKLEEKGMNRVTIGELYRAMKLLSERTGEEYTLDIANGGYRLANEDGSHIFSKRVSKRELRDQIWLAIEVMAHGNGE